MGHYYSRNFNYQDEPANRYGPDPDIFEKYEDTDRPVREMGATTEEMNLGGLARVERDYCAHSFMKYLKCRRDWFPETFRCHEEQAKHSACKHDNAIHRRLEYERTKRLMLRDRAKIEE